MTFEVVSIDTAALALSRQRFDEAYIANQQKWITDVFGIKNVSVLHTFSRDEANSASFVEPLRHTTAVWIWGGSHEALARVYPGTRAQKEIRAVLDRGGIVGGSSSGAMILGLSCRPGR